ncbi:hypothetical protein R2R35_19730 [Anaerocolumna sp. AGMB13020]|uniref:hypothetical protein n=1 Tax=Anaerocolumna sp. AGMB13020 TaxID=3081750 RepID=UPI002954BAB4|nr:hypothetical protein [Anaerocolumna sp. AGMB13020]WOO36003.1 hypothetical protein R2R35_19730 [Anaerocolumna sp. AGMB13020]
MTDEEIYLKMEDYINKNGLKKLPIDKSLPLINDYACKISSELGRDRKEIFNLYFDWRSDVILGKRSKES